MVDVVVHRNADIESPAGLWIDQGFQRAHQPRISHRQGFGVEESTVIDSVEFEDQSKAIVVSVHPRKGREAALRSVPAALPWL